MLPGFHFTEDRFDAAVRPDDKGASFDAHVFFSVHALFDPDAIGFQYLAGGVAQESEGQVVFVDELAVAFYAVRVDTEDGGTALQEGLILFLDGAGLLGAAGCVILGVKVKDEGSSGKICKSKACGFHIFPADGQAFKIRSLVSRHEQGFHICRILPLEQDSCKCAPGNFPEPDLRDAGGVPASQTS